MLNVVGGFFKKSFVGEEACRMVLNLTSLFTHISFDQAVPTKIPLFEYCCQISMYRAGIFGRASINSGYHVTPLVCSFPRIERSCFETFDLSVVCLSVSFCC